AKPGERGRPSPPFNFVHATGWRFEECILHLPDIDWQTDFATTDYAHVHDEDATRDLESLSRNRKAQRKNK
ncbi:MAG: hypothetical protein ACREEJ_01340, partial [Ensifer adhaerens]